MSCDYGFYCSDCDKSIIVNNMRSYSVFDALNGVHALATLSRAMKEIAISTVDTIDIQAYWCEEIGDLIQFAEDHEHHTLFVIDEYQWTYDFDTEERHEHSRAPRLPL